MAWCSAYLAPMGQAPARHHQLLIRHLEMVTRGEIDRLLVMMPPGAAKSTYCSQLFPAWWLAQNPELTVLTASHTAELAVRFGRRVRNLVRQNSAVLGYSLSPDSHAAGRWETDQGGEYYAAGVDGSVTGRRADLVVIDDPIRGRKDADSQAKREAVWEWYQNDLLTRLKPHAAIVMVMTRWHEDDLGGRVLEEMATGGEPWHVLRVPMLAEGDDPLGRQPGEVLWPEWYTPQMLATAQRNPRVWTSLYQQRPSPETGSYFRREWIRATPNIPPRESLRIWGGSDYAVTEGGGDYTVHVVLGVDPDGRMYLLDLWRGQTDSAVWVEEYINLVLRWRPIGWAEETGQIRAALGPYITRRMRERRASVARHEFPTRHDKAIRAQAIRGRMALDGLYVPADAPWRADLESELLAFPAGKNDDQVDALGLVGQLLDQMQPKSRGQFGPEKPADRYAHRRRPPGGSGWTA